ncbi:MAG: homoserine dehydrogenase [Chthoniobacterales bacterium]
MKSIGIGLAGFGTVGSGVWKNLTENAALISGRLGVQMDVKKIAVRDLTKKRGVVAPAQLFTDSWREMLDDPAVEIVVELIGGTDEARELVLASIDAGKIVVTGNKALLAEQGKEIFQYAREKKVPIFYEAAVAGGIPIIKALRESFVGNRFESIQGILNGTSNYILTRMEEAGLDFSEALAEAQKLGYAEADPALDVNGWDAAHKAIIIASIAFGKWVEADRTYVAGIEGVTSADIRFAKQLGFRIKLLGTIRAREDRSVEVRVCPTLIPQGHVLASVGGVFNAIWLNGDVAGESLFYGRGAGQDPTASSVLSDLADAVGALKNPCRCFGFTGFDLYDEYVSPDEAVSQFYLRLSVEDRPGVLAQIAGLLGAGNIGISSVIQPEGKEGDALPLILILHYAPQGKVVEALKKIEKLDCVKASPVLMHVEEFE